MAKIEILTLGNGTAIVSNYDPVNGEVVTLTCTPDTGELIIDVVGWDSQGHSIALGAVTTQTFTWDDTWVSLTIKAVFTPKITITVNGNGTAVVDNYNPNTGELVNLTITPDWHYTISSVIGYDENENPIALQAVEQQSFRWQYLYAEIFVTIGYAGSGKKRKSMPIWEYPSLYR